MSRLKEIEERCEKAAPEPWCSHDPGMYCGYACTPDGCYENHDSPVRQLEGPATEWPEPNGGPVDDGTLQCFTIADADFIAHARSDIPYLISELRAALARAERAEAVVREAGEMLKQREWDDPVCPEGYLEGMACSNCLAHEDNKHDPGCHYAALLARIAELEQS